MTVSTLRAAPRANQATSSACMVADGPLRYKATHQPTTHLCLLAEQDPSALLEFREGEMLSMEYYDADSILPSEHLKTSVRKIKRNDGGRLKGQYLVDLEILKSYH